MRPSHMQLIMAVVGATCMLFVSACGSKTPIENKPPAGEPANQAGSDKKAKVVEEPKAGEPANQAGSDKRAEVVEEPKPDTPSAEHVTTVSAGTTLRIGDRVHHVYPYDPENPYSKKTWYYEKPASAVDVKYDLAGRRLSLKLLLYTPDSAIKAAKELLVKRYHTEGKKNITAEDIELLESRLRGYRIFLNIEGKSIQLEKDLGADYVGTGSIGVEFKVPPADEDLHNRLADPVRRSHLNIVFRGIYQYDVHQTSAIEARLLQAHVKDVLETILPGVPAGATVLVNREAKAQIDQAFNSRLQVAIRRNASDPSVAFLLGVLQKGIERQILDLKPLSWAELSTLSEAPQVYTSRQAKLEIEPEQQNLVKTGFEKFNEYKRVVEKEMKSVSEKARDKMVSAKDFHKELRKMQLKAEADGRYSWLVSVNLKLHLDKEELREGSSEHQEFEKAREFLQNEEKYREEVFEKSSEKFQGRDEIKKVIALGLSVFRKSFTEIYTEVVTKYVDVLSLRTRLVSSDQSFLLEDRPRVGILDAEELAGSIEKVRAELKGGLSQVLREAITENGKLEARTKLPAGTVLLFCGEKPPEGWLICNGTSYSIKDYPRLASLLGRRFGGDGVNSFKVPDLKGRTVFGAGKGEGLEIDHKFGERGGKETHSLAVDEMPSGFYSPPKMTIARGDRGEPVGLIVKSGTWEGRVLVTTGEPGKQGSGKAFVIVPPNLPLHFIIKY